jgi:hypothetical protein
MATMGQERTWEECMENKLQTDKWMGLVVRQLTAMQMSKEGKKQEVCRQGM